MERGRNCIYFQYLQIPVNEKLLNDSNRYVLHTEKSIYVYKSSGNTQINNVTDRLANTIQNDRSAIIGKVFTNN